MNDTKVELIISIPKTSSETLELHDLIVELDFGIIELKDLDSVTFQDARLSLQAGLINSTVSLPSLQYTNHILINIPSVIYVQNNHRQDCRDY